MSVTQNFDSYSSGNTAAGTGAPNADFDLKDAQLDEASAGADGQSGILSGGIGQVAQNATQIVSLGFCYFSSAINIDIFFKSFWLNLVFFSEILFELKFSHSLTHFLLFWSSHNDHISLSAVQQQLHSFANYAD